MHVLSHNRSFDHTEFEGYLTPSNVAHLPPISSGSPVLFRGTLPLHVLAHLSEEGQNFLNHALKERVIRSAMNGVLGARRHTSTNIETIFALKAKQKNIPEAEKYYIKVLIQGYMHSTASFMRCMSMILYPFRDDDTLSLTVADLAPNGLLFHTANADKTK
jgi:hypothetical protein